MILELLVITFFRQFGEGLKIYWQVVKISSFAHFCSRLNVKAYKRQYIALTLDLSDLSFSAVK